MKKKIACIICICLLTLVIVSSIAETYTFDSLDFSISCSKEWIPFYKDLSDTQLSQFNISKQDVNDTLNHYGLYDTDFVFENYNDHISLMILKNKEYLSLRLKDQDDVFLKSFLGTFIPSIERNHGLEIASYNLFKTDDNLFVQYECPSPQYMITYFTTADGISYNFSFLFYNKTSITKEQKELTEQIMRTVLWKWQ